MTFAKVIELHLNSIEIKKNILEVKTNSHFVSNKKISKKFLNFIIYFKNVYFIWTLLRMIHINNANQCAYEFY